MQETCVLSLVWELEPCATTKSSQALTKDPAYHNKDLEQREKNRKTKKQKERGGI